MFAKFLCFLFGEFCNLPVSLFISNVHLYIIYMIRKLFPVSILIFFS